MIALLVALSLAAILQAINPGGNIVSTVVPILCGILADCIWGKKPKK